MAMLCENEEEEAGGNSGKHIIANIMVNPYRTCQQVLHQYMGGCPWMEPMHRAPTSVEP